MQSYTLATEYETHCVISNHVRTANTLSPHENTCR